MPTPHPLCNDDAVDYIECLFVDGTVADAAPGPMPGVIHYSPAAAAEHVERRSGQGITRFLVFGVPARKGLDLAGAPDAVVPSFLRTARGRMGTDVELIADVGLSPYSVDGHSVVLGEDGGPDHERSYAAAADLAAAFAVAGADTVAPCLSLPQQVGRIAERLRADGLPSRVMPYSAKFSSALYGPYRAAVRSPLGAARKAYQTDYSDVPKARSQVLADVEQGAAAIIVKPAMMYLDVLQQVCAESTVPVAAYHVSGEYLALVLAAEQGGMDRQELFDEFHSAVERCGADAVIGYAADDYLRRWA